MAACPCWGDRGTAPGPALTEATCARRVTAAERPAAAPTTTNSGVSGSSSLPQKMLHPAAVALVSLNAFSSSQVTPYLLAKLSTDPTRLRSENKHFKRRLRVVLEDGRDKAGIKSFDFVISSFRFKQSDHFSNMVHISRTSKFMFSLFSLFPLKQIP